MISENENISRKLIEAYNKFDINSLLEFHHPEIDFKNISNGKIDTHTKGKKEFENLDGKSDYLFKKREHKIISIKESETNDEMEIKLKAGDSISMKGKSEYQFKDGLIISLTDVS